ncbi:hypothetical protein QL285_039509 [Trifolium repens]|nr:hypothetical protein QL285_039509 [Trifolium repens]
MLMALFWCVSGGLGLFCSFSWKLLQVGLVVGGTRLVRFGFGKTRTLLVRGGGGDERSSWSCPMLLVVFASCLISLRSNYIVASRFGFGLSFRAVVGWRFLLSRGCLISEC